MMVARCAGSRMGSDVNPPTVTARGDSLTAAESWRWTVPAGSPPQAVAQPRPAGYRQECAQVEHQRMVATVALRRRQWVGSQVGLTRLPSHGLRGIAPLPAHPSCEGGPDRAAISVVWSWHQFGMPGCQTRHGSDGPDDPDGQ